VYEAITRPKTRWAVVARTHADVRDTCFEGESGVLSVLKRYGLYSEQEYNRSRTKINLPNGSMIKGFSAEEPDTLRGPQHHGAWCDELAAWEYEDTWDQLQFGLRLGENPRVVVTTTPRPTQLIRDLVSRSTTYVTRGSTFDNAANLSSIALAELQARYNETRLGRQELYGEILEDVEGALWTRGLIERCRVTEHPHLSRIVVSIDPAVTNTASSDETGIVVAGCDTSGHGYLIADHSMRGSPLDWATRAVALFDEYKADSILVEVNQGGDMVSAVLKQVRPVLPIREIRAHVGKKLRAEPVAAMYEQGRVHHVGQYAKLEDQMTTWTPADPTSPDRLDAMVQAFSDLLGTSSISNYFSSLANICPKCSMPNPKSMHLCAKCGTAIIVATQKTGGL
jgi:phage terminase large subunit-like protein